MTLPADRLGDQDSRSDLVRLSSSGRFGGWLVLVREPRYSVVFGWVRFVPAYSDDGHDGLVRELDADIGFGTRGALESVCALLRGWSVIINEPWYSAVSGWLRVVAVCRSGRCPADRSGNRTSDPDPVPAHRTWPPACRLRGLLVSVRVAAGMTVSRE